MVPAVPFNSRDSGFQPSKACLRATQAVGLGWDGYGPLALQVGGGGLNPY